MSYEGYRENLCANGHRWSVDCDDDDGVCKFCHGVPVWSIAVDETNDCQGYISDEGWARLDTGVVDTFPASFDCKSVMCTKVYRIPSPEETESLRQYPNHDDECDCINCVGEEAYHNGCPGCGYCKPFDHWLVEELVGRLEWAEKEVDILRRKLET